MSDNIYCNKLNLNKNITKNVCLIMIYTYVYIILFTIKGLPEKIKVLHDKNFGFVILSSIKISILYCLFKIF